ncbi:MAG TPA: hypothetical protein VNY52_13250 [Solirubrobacteraceae bacterium]|jgi:hypothetical protein|nr:hypothetical protein [Solirubrobacteraceae bacterium]
MRVQLRVERAAHPVPVGRRDQALPGLDVFAGVPATDHHRRVFQMSDRRPDRLFMAAHELARDVLRGDGEQDAERLRRGEREVVRGDLRVVRGGAQSCRGVAWVVAGDQRTELPGAYPTDEAEGVCAGADPFAGGLSAAGVVVVLALGDLLLVVAVLTQCDLADREHLKPK